MTEETQDTINWIVQASEVDWKEVADDMREIGEDLLADIYTDVARREGNRIDEMKTRIHAQHIYVFQCPYCLIKSGTMSDDRNKAPTCCGGVTMDAVKVV